MIVSHLTSCFCFTFLQTVEIFNDFNKYLHRWQHRKLTLLGKVTVLKTYAVNQNNHRYSHIYIDMFAT